MADSYLNSNNLLDIATRNNEILVVGNAYTPYSMDWNPESGIRPKVEVSAHQGNTEHPVMVCVYVEPAMPTQGVAVAAGLAKVNYFGSGGSTKKRLFPSKDGSGRFTYEAYGFPFSSGGIISLSTLFLEPSPSFLNTYVGSYALSVLDDAEYDPVTGEITKNPTAKVGNGYAYVGREERSFEVKEITFPIEECKVLCVFNTTSRTGNYALVSEFLGYNKPGPGFEILDVGSFAYNADFKKWYAVQHYTGGSYVMWWRY